MLSVSSSAINNYENEVRSPTVDFLYLLYIHEGVMPNWIMLGCGNIYEEDCPREELIPELYHERSIVNKIIEGLHLESEITSKQRDAIVEIIKEELKKKVTAIVQAITG